MRLGRKGKMMKKVAFAIMLVVVGCNNVDVSTCEETETSYLCDGYGKGFDVEFNKSKLFDDDLKSQVIKGSEIVDSEYENYDELTKVAFNASMLLWEKDEMHASCRALPSVEYVDEFSNDGCEDAVGCFWKESGGRLSPDVNKIELDEAYHQNDCGLIAETLHHEFLHFFLRCNYQKSGHPAYYFDTYTYDRNVEAITDVVCQAMEK